MPFSTIEILELGLRPEKKINPAGCRAPGGLAVNVSGVDIDVT